MLARIGHIHRGVEKQVGGAVGRPNRVSRCISVARSGPIHLSSFARKQLTSRDVIPTTTHRCPLSPLWQISPAPPPNQLADPVNRLGRQRADQQFLHFQVAELDQKPFPFHADVAFLQAAIRELASRTSRAIPYSRPPVRLGFLGMSAPAGFGRRRGPYSFPCGTPWGGMCAP